MAINTFLDLQRSDVNRLSIDKSGITTRSPGLCLLAGFNGFPGPVSYPNNTTTGEIPSALTSGFPSLPSQSLYFSSILNQQASGSQETIELIDLLWWAGSTTIPTSGSTTVLLSTPQPISALRGSTDIRIAVFAVNTTSNNGHSVRLLYQDNSDADITDAPTTSTQNLRPGNMAFLQFSNLKNINGYQILGVSSASGSVGILAYRSLGFFHGKSNFLQSGLLQIDSNSALSAISYGNWASTGAGLSRLFFEVRSLYV